MNWVIIASVDGLLPDGIKPLTEPKSTQYQFDSRNIQHSLNKKQLLALCEGNPLSEGPVVQNFNASFIASLKKLLNKQLSC